jgi:hypothetical protein
LFKDGSVCPDLVPSRGNLIGSCIDRKQGIGQITIIAMKSETIRKTKRRIKSRANSFTSSSSEHIHGFAH